MTERGAIGLCTVQPLRLWLEPWCDEFALEPRAEVCLAIVGGDTEPFPELEFRNDALVV